VNDVKTEYRLAFGININLDSANNLRGRIAAILERGDFGSLTILFSSEGGSTDHSLELFNFISQLPVAIHAIAMVHQGASRSQSGMTLDWSPEAINDLASLRAHISLEDPAAAKHVALHILHGVEELLSQNPELGHPGRVPGTRELFIPKTPFVVPYRVHDDVLQILRVSAAGRNTCSIGHIAQSGVSSRLLS
jgi:toxin ParE1/3/4